MDGTTLVDTLTDDLETELSRLGSSKWLYALTDGDMTGEAIRAAAAADAAAAAETFADWDGDLFDTLAADAADRRDALDADADAADRETYDALASFDDPVERAGGALGYALVVDRTLGQMVGFFVGDADPSTANDFRGFRDDHDAVQEAILDTLETRCDSDDAWERAEDAATTVIDATYDDYVETLEAMGVQPKNVC
ncbi:hypothetical protein SAMN04488065_2100 [Haloplanus vescus]|uniref:Transcription antitermination protein n=1 Tax=Haloplanus vescus TaxID=555874 RepID=A0A1H3Z226_9EURY|nr:hypothetical protein [Haloplanus vescus]SEA17785.1 hypothetical protein SAMN04488065_2100 [Haloplanus vescus]